MPWYSFFLFSLSLCSCLYPKDRALWALWSGSFPFLPYSSQSTIYPPGKDFSGLTSHPPEREQTTMASTHTANRARRLGSPRLAQPFSPRLRPPRCRPPPKPPPTSFPGPRRIFFPHPAPAMRAAADDCSGPRRPPHTHTRSESRRCGARAPPAPPRTPKCAQSQPPPVCPKSPPAIPHCPQRCAQKTAREANLEKKKKTKSNRGPTNQLRPPRRPPPRFARAQTQGCRRPKIAKLHTKMHIRLCVLGNFSKCKNLACVVCRAGPSPSPAGHTPAVFALSSPQGGGGKQYPISL